MRPAHGLALNVHLFQLGAGVDHGRISRVCGHQGQRSGVVIYPLEGGFAINAHRRDLSVLYHRLYTDIHHIFIVDTGIHHAVTVAGQGKVAPDVLRHVHHLFNVLLCCNGVAAGYAADQGDLLHLRHRLKARRDGGGRGRVLRRHWISYFYICAAIQIVHINIKYEYKLTDAIKDGYLCRIMAQTIPLKLDISAVGMSSGDYSVGELGTALDPYLSQIADEMAARCAGRKTVVFLPLIKTSQKFRDLLNTKGFRAAEVNGQSADRRQVLSDFEADKYNVLCNSMLLTEGWDCPSVDCVVVLRPTKVRSLYSQMVGRGTRLSPGKKDLLLLDFLWMTDKHELCRPADLVCEDRVVARQMTDNLAESGGPQDIEDAAAQASEDVVAQREEALAKQLKEQRRKKAKLVDPLQYEMSIQAEDLSGYVPAFGWEAGPPSAKQTAALEKLGILPDAVESAGKAALLFDRLSKRRDEGLTTPKQIRCLEKYGFQHVGTWSFEAARHMIDRIAAGGWRGAPKGVDPKNYIPSAEPVIADDMLLW